MNRALMGRQLSRELALAPSMPSMMTAEEKLDEIGAELRRLMNERLFVASNFESKSGETAVYGLRPDPTCRPLPAEGAATATVPAIDEECASDLMKVEMRLAVRADGDGARVTVLVGGDRHELLTLIVRSDLLALEVSLAKAKAAADHIETQLGDGAPMEKLARLGGKVRFAIEKRGDQRVVVSVSLLEPLDIATVPGAATPIELQSAAANPLVSLESDGVGKRAILVLGQGQTSVATKWDPRGTGATNRDLRYTFGGYYGRFELDESAKRIDITDAGFGQARLMVRDALIMDLNLNANSNRRFSGSVTVNSDDTPRITVRPEINVSAAFDYAQIASELETPPDTALLHDAYDVVLAGAGGSAVIQGVNESGTFAGGLGVVTGTLTLNAAGPPAASVVVPQGRCLTTVSPAPDGSHPFLGRLQVADCPPAAF
jgi:hypothetical protein